MYMYVYYMHIYKYIIYIITIITWQNFKPAKSHNFSYGLRLTVMSQISRPHGRAQKPHGSLRVLFLNTCWRIFSRFQKQKQSELIILPIQIGKFQINAWVSLATLPGIGCGFYNLIFRLVVFNMHKKEECVLPDEVADQRNLSKDASTASTTKISEWRCPTITSLVSLKSIFLKIEDSLCV